MYYFDGCYIADGMYRPIVDSLNSLDRIRLISNIFKLNVKQIAKR